LSHRAENGYFPKKTVLYAFFVHVHIFMSSKIAFILTVVVVVVVVVNFISGLLNNIDNKEYNSKPEKGYRRKFFVNLNENEYLNER